MMRAVKDWNPRLVGLVVGAVLTAFVLAAFSLSVISFGTATYSAEFARAGGARPGDEVRIAGVGVGKVTAVELEDDHVVITFNVDDDVHLGEETRAQVKLATLLGNSYLEISPEGTGDLTDDTIPLAHTTVTFDVQRAIEGSGAVLGKLDARKIRTALEVTSDAFRHTPAAVRLTLDGLARVSRAVADRREEIAALIDGASRVVRTLRSRSGDIVGLMQQSDLLFSELLSRRQAIDDLILGTRTMAAQLTGLVQDNAAATGPFLDRLDTVTAALEERKDDVDRALRAIAPAARYATNVIGSGPFADVRLPYLTPDNALCRSGVIQGCS